MGSEIRDLAAGVIQVEAETIEAAAFVVGRRGGGAEPQIVVESFRHRHRLPARSGLHRVDLGDLRENPFHLSDPPVADQFAGPSVIGAGTIMAAGLQHTPVLADRLDHRLTLSHRESQRLLTVDVLSGAAGHHGDQCVPMIGHHTHYGINIFPRQHVAEIFIRITAAEHPRRLPCRVECVDLLLSRLAAEKLVSTAVAVAGGVHVANGQHLAVVMTKKRRQVDRALVAAADQADVNPIARRRNPQDRRRHNRGSPEDTCGSGRQLQEVAASLPPGTVTLTACTHDVPILQRA